MLLAVALTAQILALSSTATAQEHGFSWRVVSVSENGDSDRPVFPSLAATAQEPQRGWLGVSLSVSEDGDRPLGVSQVSEDGPAARAGVRVGDRLVGLAGRELDDYDALIGLLTELGPGRETSLTVRRTLAVRLDGRGWGDGGAPRLGVRLAQSDSGDGVRWIVRQAEDGWPAARAGVRDGDRIVDLAGREPGDFDELQSILAEVAPEHELRLTVERELQVHLGPDPRTPEPPDFGGRFVPSERYELLPETAPDGSRRLRIAPRGEGGGELQFGAPRGESPDLERQLREEISGLNRELRALREELATLRRELAALRQR